MVRGIDRGHGLGHRPMHGGRGLGLGHCGVGRGRGMGHCGVGRGPGLMHARPMYARPMHARPMHAPCPSFFSRAFWAPRPRPTVVMAPPMIHTPMPYRATAAGACASVASVLTVTGVACTVFGAAAASPPLFGIGITALGLGFTAAVTAVALRILRL